MTKKLVACIMLVSFTLFACAGAREPVKPPPVEMDPMPEVPDADVKPEDNWVKSVEEPEDCTGKKGILMSEEKATALAKYRVAYPGLRHFCELDRELWSGKWQISQRLLIEADRKIEDMQPSWWDRNKGTIGFFGGMLVGALTTIAVIYGVVKVEEGARQ